MSETERSDIKSKHSKHESYAYSETPSNLEKKTSRNGSKKSAKKIASQLTEKQTVESRKPDEPNSIEENSKQNIIKDTSKQHKQTSRKGHNTDKLRIEAQDKSKKKGTGDKHAREKNDKDKTKKQKSNSRSIKTVKSGESLNISSHKTNASKPPSIPPPSLPRSHTIANISKTPEIDFVFTMKPDIKINIEDVEEEELYEESKPNIVDFSWFLCRSTVISEIGKELNGSICIRVFEAYSEVFGKCIVNVCTEDTYKEFVSRETFITQIQVLKNLASCPFVLPLLEYVSTIDLDPYLAAKSMQIDLAMTVNTETKEDTDEESSKNKKEIIPDEEEQIIPSEEETTCSKKSVIDEASKKRKNSDSKEHKRIKKSSKVDKATKETRNKKIEDENQEKLYSKNTNVKSKSSNDLASQSSTTDSVHKHAKRNKSDKHKHVDSSISSKHSSVSKTASVQKENHNKEAKKNDTNKISSGQEVAKEQLPETKKSDFKKKVSKNLVVVKKISSKKRSDKSHKAKCPTSPSEQGKNITKNGPSKSDVPDSVDESTKHHLVASSPVLEHSAAEKSLDFFLVFKNYPDVLLWAAENSDIYIEKLVCEFVRNIAQALVELHKLKYMHRAITPNSILISDDGQALLSGLESAMEVDYEALHKPLRLILCPTRYRPPELISEIGNQSIKIDSWGLGVTTFAMLVGHPPFTENNHLLLEQAIKEKELYFNDDEWSGISENARNFCSVLCMKEPDQRPTIKEILEHPWLTGTEVGKKKLFVNKQNLS